MAPCPAWLDSDWLLSSFGKRRSSAIAKFQRFVAEGKGLPSPLDETRHQLLLGDDSFVQQFRHDPKANELREHSQAQRRALALTLDEFATQAVHRNDAMVAAYKSTAYTMQEIADFFGVHITTVSRVIIKSEQG